MIYHQFFPLMWVACLTLPWSCAHNHYLKSSSSCSSIKIAIFYPLFFTMSQPNTNKSPPTNRTCGHSHHRGGMKAMPSISLPATTVTHLTMDTTPHCTTCPMESPTVDTYAVTVAGQNVPPQRDAVAPLEQPFALMGQFDSFRGKDDNSSACDSSIDGGFFHHCRQGLALTLDSPRHP